MPYDTNFTTIRYRSVSGSDQTQIKWNCVNLRKFIWKFHTLLRVASSIFTQLVLWCPMQLGQFCYSFQKQCNRFLQELINIKILIPSQHSEKILLDYFLQRSFAWNWITHACSPHCLLFSLAPSSIPLDGWYDVMQIYKLFFVVHLLLNRSTSKSGAFSLLHNCSSIWQVTHTRSSWWSN